MTPKHIFYIEAIIILVMMIISFTATKYQEKMDTNPCDPLTDSVDMVKIAGEQLIFTNRFGFVALVLALGSYIFDIIDK